MAKTEPNEVRGNSPNAGETRARARTTPVPEPQRPESLREAVQRMLGDVIEGVEFLDRDIELGGGRHADFAALDSRGRLVLVVVALGPVDETVLRTIDALDFARRELALLAEHFQSARLRTDFEPLVAIVAADLESSLQARLASLDPRSVRCFELRKITSAAGSRTYLAEVALAPRPGALDPLRMLADASNVHSHALLADIERRLARIDGDLERIESDAEAEWRLGSQVLCTMSVESDALTAYVPTVGALRRIESLAAADSFLDDVVRRYVALSNSPSSDARGAAQAQLQIETAALLTPEEIAAFREP